MRDIKREKIIRTAEKLFEKRGYKGVSVDDIVNKVGIAKGTFYLYFVSKDALYSHILFSYAARAEERVIRIITEEKNIKVRLLRMLVGRLKFISVHPILREIFLENQSYLSPSITLEMIFAMNTAMTAKLSEGGSLSFREGVNALFLAKIHWFFTSLIRYEQECLEKDEFWKQVELFAKILIDGLFVQGKWPKVEWDTLWKGIKE